MRSSQKRESNSMKHKVTDYLCDKDCGLYLEEYFTNMLSLERKRSERSKKPFLLMLVNIEKDVDNAEKNEIARKIAHILFSITREIDIKGWMKYNHTIGVIFTEVNGVDKNSLKQKIVDHLGNILTRRQFNKVELSFYVFPENFPEDDDDNEQKTNGSVDLTLYPDVSKREGSQKASLLIKRVIDVIGSIIGLIIFFPLFLLIGLCIKVTSKGPALFKQERVGQFGGKFTFLKFRTMHINCDSSIHQEYLKKFIKEQKSYTIENGDDVPKHIYKINDDPRITPIGRLLRKTSLDELPQFINVLKGEMSLVGPRPPIPYELDNYDIWHRRRVFEIKPGITGPWQVWGRSCTTFDEMVRMEIQYMRDWSLLLDIKILLQTPWVILTSKGAY